ncbi:MAG: MFS transporter [Novosphingobium sp.]
MQDNVGKEWRRGWHLVTLTALGLVCAPTTVAPYSIGLFVVPLQESFGWSRSAIQGAILFSTGLGLAGGPLAGWLVHRFGLRPAILSGVVGIALAIGFAATISGELWQFYLAYALIALLGAGASAVTWSCLIAERFRQSRGLALGIALSGTGLSAMLTPRLAELGMDLGGWRVAYLSLAAYPLLILLPACLLLLPRFRPPEEASDVERAQDQTGIALCEVLKGRHFWLMGFSTAAIYLAVGGLIANLVPALVDKGIAQGDAVSLMGILGAAIIAGRIVVGALVDRIWAPLVAACVLVPAALGCLMLTADLRFYGYAAPVALLGLATGMEFDMLAFLVARYFGLSDYPRIYGRLHMFVAAAAGGGPAGIGALYDHVKSYDPAFILSALLLAGGSAGLLLLGRYPVIPRAAG